MTAPRSALARLAAVPLLALTAAGLWPGPAAEAQAPDRERPEGERLEPGGERRGWIGVGLRAPECETGSTDDDSEGACPPGLLIELVVIGSPADRAGLQPGDTLLAVEGQRVSPPGEGDGIPSFEPGEPLELTVARGAGRARVEVTPVVRPEPRGPVAARIWQEPPPRPDGPPSAAEAPASVQFQVRVERLPPAVLGRSTAGGEAPRGGGSRVPVVRLGDGRTVRLTSRLRSALAGELEGVSLPPALEQIRDSVLSLARAQIDSLRRHGAFRAGAAAEETAPWSPGHRRVLAAGAEMWPLTSGMAESFEGADHGLLVLRVLAGTPAGDLGLRSGDVVTRVAGQDVLRGRDLREALSRYPERDSVVVEWVRKGESMTGVMRRR